MGLNGIGGRLVMIGLLVAQGVVFLLWTVQIFAVLFHVRARAQKATGQVFPGPLAALRMMAEWGTDPAQRGPRLRLIVLTLLLLAISAIWATTLGQVA